MTPTLKSRKCYSSSVSCDLPHSVGEPAWETKKKIKLRHYVHIACADHRTALRGSSPKRFFDNLNLQCSYWCEKRSQTRNSEMQLRDMLQLSSWIFCCLKRKKKQVRISSVAFTVSRTEVNWDFKLSLMVFILHHWEVQSCVTVKCDSFHCKYKPGAEACRQYVTWFTLCVR